MGSFVISPRAMSVLTVHPWEGNVRELENVIERAVVLDRDGVLGLDDLPFSGAESAADKFVDRAKSGSLTLSELEREYILEVLAECEGSRKKTGREARDHHRHFMEETQAVRERRLLVRIVESWVESSRLLEHLGRPGV